MADELTTSRRATPEVEAILTDLPTDLQGFFKAMAAPPRVAVILQLLKFRNLSFSELRTTLNLPSNLLTYHLKILLDEAFIHRHECDDGTIYYESDRFVEKLFAGLVRILAGPSIQEAQQSIDSSLPLMYAGAKATAVAPTIDAFAQYSSIPQFNPSNFLASRGKDVIIETTITQSYKLLMYPESFFSSNEANRVPITKRGPNQ